MPLPSTPYPVTTKITNLLLLPPGVTMNLHSPYNMTRCLAARPAGFSLLANL